MGQTGIIGDISNSASQNANDDFTQTFVAGSLNRDTPIRSPLQNLSRSNTVAAVVVALVVLGAVYYFAKRRGA